MLLLTRCWALVFQASSVLKALTTPLASNSIPNTVAVYGLHWQPETAVPGSPASAGPVFTRGLLAPPAPDIDPPTICSPGHGPLFSARMIYQVHLLLVLIAATLVVYVLGTLLLCLVQVRKWRRWEGEHLASAAWDEGRAGAHHQPQEDPNGAWRHEGGGSGLPHAVKALVAVLTVDLCCPPVSRTVFNNVRLLFIDRLGLGGSFDMASFVER